MNITATSPRFKSLEIAGSITFERNLPDIASQIDKNQSETAKAILSLYDINEDAKEVLLSKETIAPIQIPKPKQMKLPKKFSYFQRRSTNKKMLMLGTSSNLSLDKSRLLTQFNTPTAANNNHSLNFPTILTPSKFTMDSYSSRNIIMESPARNHKVFSIQCDNIETGCQKLKKSIIVNKPKQLSVSSYYLPKEQDRAFLHKRDIESLEEKEENKQLMELIERQHKSRIMQESVMVHKMSTSLAFDAKQLMTKMFLKNQRSPVSFDDCHRNIRKENIKKNVAKMDKILTANVFANKKCKVYLNEFTKKNTYANTVQ